MNIADAERIRKLMKESMAEHEHDLLSDRPTHNESFEKLHEATTLLLEKLIESDSQVNRLSCFIYEFRPRT